MYLFYEHIYYLKRKTFKVSYDDKCRPKFTHVTPIGVATTGARGTCPLEWRNKNTNKQEIERRLEGGREKVSMKRKCQDPLPVPYSTICLNVAVYVPS